MPRKARFLPSLSMVHLIARGNNVSLFRRKCDYYQIARTLQRYITGKPFFVRNYAFMKTHIHLLAWVENAKCTAEILKAIFLAYHHYYRKNYDFKGHLWHGRYKSVLIASEEQQWRCGRYIELNPVHAGICKDPEDYKWSSYHYYAFGKKDSLITPAPHLKNEFDWKYKKENADYQRFTKEGIDMDYHRLKTEFENQIFPAKTL